MLRLYTLDLRGTGLLGRAFFWLRACLDPRERERESAKFLLSCTFFALLDPNTPKCKRANTTVILLIMD
jgi:hypothetical protein